MSTDKKHSSKAGSQAGAVGRSRPVRGASTKMLRPSVARADTSDLAAAFDQRAAAFNRLASLPSGFTDWVVEAPAWPADLPETIGPRPR